MLLLDRYDFGQQDPNAIWATYANINSRTILISGESLQVASSSTRTPTRRR